MYRRRVNCWEFQGCGREPGGTHVDELGVCEAAVESRLDGENGGRNAGRACWVISGTLCNGVVCGSFDEKYPHCRKCVFFELVQEEQGGHYVDYITLLLKLAARSAIDEPVGD